LVEATRGDLKFTAPFAGSVGGSTVIVAVAAFVAPWRSKADIMKLVGVCALLGLVCSVVP
jgi:chromate transporter